MGRPKKVETLVETLTDTVAEIPESAAVENSTVILKSKEQIALEIIDEIYKDLTADQKRIPNFKKAASERYLLLRARLDTQSQEARYPEAEVKQFAAEFKAIKIGLWLPGWKLPTKLSPYEEFMRS